MNDKTKSAPKEAEITIYKCHNCGFKYYEKANYCTQCGHEQLEGVKQIMNKKEAAQDERLVWDEVSEVTWDKADQYGVTW